MHRAIGAYSALKWMSFRVIVFIEVITLIQSAFERSVRRQEYLSAYDSTSSVIDRGRTDSETVFIVPIKPANDA